MRVAFFSPAWPLSEYPNGIVSYVEYLRPALAALGVESVVAAGKVAPGYESDEVADIERHLGRSLLERLTDRLRGDHRGVGKIRLGRGVVRAIQSLPAGRDIDLVETEEGFGLCRHIDEYIDCPTIVRLHGPWFLNGPALGVPRDAEFDLRVRHEGEALARARHITSPSQDVLDQTREFYGLPLEQAVVIPNSCPTVERASRWTEAGADPDRILFVGRFDAHKGGDLVIDAMKKVLAQRPDTKLWFAGPDNGVPDAESDGGQISAPAYLERAIPDPGLRARVELLGPCDSTRIVAMRREAAVTVVASRYENFPMTVLEAVAHGSPLVATDVGGIGEIVEHEKTGLLVAGSSAEALSHGLLRLLADRPLACTMAERAGEEANQRFSPEGVAAATHAFYQDVLAREGR